MGIEDENIFDDFELAEPDFEDSWEDEDFEESVFQDSDVEEKVSTNQPKKSSKKLAGVFKYVFFIFLLLCAFFAYQYYRSMLPEKLKDPVVLLQDKNQDRVVDLATENDLFGESEKVNTSENIHKKAIESVQNSASEAVNDSDVSQNSPEAENKSGVLTPFPSSSSASDNVDLPALYESELESASFEGNLENQKGNADDQLSLRPIKNEANQLQESELDTEKDLNESELLSRTNEDPTVVDNEISVVDDGVGVQVDQHPMPEGNKDENGIDDDEEISTSSDLQSVNSAEVKNDDNQQNLDILHPEKAPEKIIDKSENKKQQVFSEQINLQSAEAKKKLPEPTWIIRAVQPGKALIYDKVPGEVRSVEINSNVNPIGRILAIEKQSGKWVIKGTNGTIK